MTGTDPPRDITALLNQAARGDADAGRRVFPAIYEELRELARRKRSQLPAGATLQTTALVHEAYMRIVGRNPEGWESIRHFYFTAARAMRDLLVEEARRRLTRKRSGRKTQVALDENADWGLDSPPEDILALDSVLDRLEKEDAEGHQLVTLRFYAGLNFQEIADVLGVSLRTTERKWRFLRVWLMRELEDSPIRRLSSST